MTAKQKVLKLHPEATCRRTEVTWSTGVKTPCYEIRLADWEKVFVRGCSAPFAWRLAAVKLAL